MIAPARTAAFHALRAVGTTRTNLAAALARSRPYLTDDRDRALAVEIVTGTLRWQRSLDCLIEHFSRRAAGRLDADVLLILRLSLYQILHLDRVPAAAVVDDAVDLVRLARKPSAAGFVNAVLRNTLRHRTQLPLPPRPADAGDRSAMLAYLGVTHSHPDWLVARWLDRYGFDATERWVRFNNEIPLLTLRANRLRVTREALQVSLAAAGIDTTPTRLAPDGLIVTGGNPMRLPQGGDFFVQDEASQLVPFVVGAQRGDTILDLCASPGGKTTAMAADMANGGTLVASDVRDRRIALLDDTVRSSGATNVRVVRVGNAGTLPFKPHFDRVLVDAPCSGLGTVRRDPDIRWRRADAELGDLAARQEVLLARAGQVLRPGGRLVYATCSSEPEENEGVVRAFLAQHADFRLVDLRREGTAVLEPVLDGEGMLRTLPFAHGLEAFFAAAMTRDGRS